MTKEERRLEARKAYETALATAYKAYEANLVPAEKAYEVISIPAWDAYLAELKKIDEEE